MEIHEFYQKYANTPIADRQAKFFAKSGEPITLSQIYIELQNKPTPARKELLLEIAEVFMEEYLTPKNQ